jgi:hypothetical protein
VRFQDAIYVLHVFQKKSTKGIATPTREINLISLHFSRVLDAFALESQLDMLNRVRVAFSGRTGFSLSGVDFRRDQTKGEQAEACPTGRRPICSLTAAAESAKSDCEFL